MLAWRIGNLRRQLQESRYRLNQMYDDFAMPLYNMTFIATKDVWRISTNGNCIYFDPDWLQKLGIKELDFILMHQLMHIALGHIERPAYYRGDRYHLAADIVANGHLGEMGWQYDKLRGIGRIRFETFFPAKSGAKITSSEAIKYIPIDPSVMEVTKRRHFMIDSDEWWERTDDSGESGTIVLSPLDKEPENLEYDGPTYGGKYKFLKELYTTKQPESGSLDDGDTRGNREENQLKMAISKLRQEASKSDCGGNIGNQERYWSNGNATVLNWRAMLNSFVQEEIFDYSFMPPDRRMADMDFFLPDYNEHREIVRNVLFMVDTSGSITDEVLYIAFDEIKQAIEQFNGMLEGTVVFFDTTVHRATKFSNVDDICNLKPFGGGGTDYECIFNYVRNSHIGDRPTSNVIITDGEGAYPAEEAADNIPVLWLITGKNMAPWGRSVQIKGR